MSGPWCLSGCICYTAPMYIAVAAPTNIWGLKHRERVPVLGVWRFLFSAGSRGRAPEAEIFLALRRSRGGAHLFTAPRLSVAELQYDILLFSSAFFSVKCVIYNVVVNEMYFMLRFVNFCSKKVRWSETLSLMGKRLLVYVLIAVETESRINEKPKQVLKVREIPRNTAWNAKKCGKLQILKVSGRFQCITDVKVPKMANCQIGNVKR